MAQIHLPHFPHYKGWDAFTGGQKSVLKMLLPYALPLSLVPPVMIYYAGRTYGGYLLPLLTDIQLQTIGLIFFMAELVMTFLVAFVIRRLGEIVDIKPEFEDCYKLAVVAPTPLWLAPLFLFIPSFIFNISVCAAALLLSGILIFYCVPPILKVRDEGQAILLSSAILVAGMVAWAAMMLLTLLSWSFVTSSLILEI